MIARLDELPAVPALDGATSQLRTAVNPGVYTVRKNYRSPDAAHAQCCFVLTPNQTQ